MHAIIYYEPSPDPEMESSIGFWRIEGIGPAGQEIGLISNLSDVLSAAKDAGIPVNEIRFSAEAAKRLRITDPRFIV